MTAKLTRKETKTLAEDLMAKKQSTALQKTPKQTIIALPSRNLTLLHCRRHGNYELEGKLIYVCRNRLTPCPKCTEENNIKRTPRKKIYSEALFAEAKLGGLTALTKAAPILHNQDTIRLKCDLCGNCFSIIVRKLTSWRFNSGRKGCASCRIRDASSTKLFNHKDYLKRLNEKHKGNITPLFTFDPMLPKKRKGKFQCQHGHIWETRIRLVFKHGCRHCAALISKPSLHKTITIGGRVFKLDSGIEEVVLHKLIKKFGIKNVQREPQPVYLYNRTYYPDFLVKGKSNILLEVKGPGTLGVTLPWLRIKNPRRCFARVQENFITCFAQGLVIRLCVVSGRKSKVITVLPEDWFTWAYEEVVAFLRKKGHRFQSLVDLV